MESQASWKATKQQVPSSSFCLPDGLQGPERGGTGWGSAPCLEATTGNGMIPAQASQKSRWKVVEAKKNLQASFKITAQRQSDGSIARRSIAGWGWAGG